MDFIWEWTQRITAPKQPDIGADEAHQDELMERQPVELPVWSRAETAPAEEGARPGEGARWALLPGGGAASLLIAAGALAGLVVLIRLLRR